MTPDAQRSSLASKGSVVLAETLTLTHPDIDTLYFVNDTQPLTLGGQLYQPFSFKGTFPEKGSTDVPTFQVVVSILDQRVMQALLSLRGQSGVKLRLTEVQVTPAPVELAYALADYAGLVTDGLSTATITATFMADILSRPYPARLVSPSNAGAAA